MGARAARGARGGPGGWGARTGEGPEIVSASTARRAIISPANRARTRISGMSELKLSQALSLICSGSAGWLAVPADERIGEAQLASGALPQSELGGVPERE